MRLALIGYGNVGRAFARLIAAKRSVYPFRIVGIHTRKGTAIDQRGLPLEPKYGPPVEPIDEFLYRARPEVMVEVTALNPVDGEPATSYIRAAFARNIHVVTANKGPIAHAYASLRDQAAREQVHFRFESTCMDGAPVFNMVRNCLPGVTIHGFTAAMNSTTKVVIDAMREGKTMADGIAEAQHLGLAEADPSYDIDGWDSAAKAASLSNVLLDARTTPQQVDRTGIGDLTTEQVLDLKRQNKTVLQITRAAQTEEGLKITVKPEILGQGDLLASATGTSNIILFHTDLMGTVGTVCITPGVEQTAYGVFSDLVDIARSLV